MTSDPAVPELTASAEDYLKAVYAVERGGDAAATRDLAHRLGVAGASVSGMVRRLAEQGLLTYERYRGVRLTAEGRRVALRTVRRHRILECYLTTVLGYPWDRVHAEAERLEHAASDDLIDRMAVALGNPAVDPHGAPIPTADGAVDEPPHVSLAEIEVGETTRVARVSERDAGMLRYLEELGIRPGARIVVTARAPYEGPITVEADGETRLIGPSLATRVLVARRSPHEDA